MDFGRSIWRVPVQYHRRSVGGFRFRFPDRSLLMQAMRGRLDIRAESARGSSLRREFDGHLFLRNGGRVAF